MFIFNENIFEGFTFFIFKMKIMWTTRKDGIIDDWQDIDIEEDDKKMYTSPRKIDK